MHRKRLAQHEYNHASCIVQPVVQMLCLSPPSPPYENQGSFAPRHSPKFVPTCYTPYIGYYLHSLMDLSMRGNGAQHFVRHQQLSQLLFLEEVSPRLDEL